MVSGFRDLLVWQRSVEFVVRIYKLIEQLPNEEKYALADQMRRAAISIPSNISEGHGRNSTKEYIQFLYIALGSASEIETQIVIGKKLGYFSNIDLEEKEINEIKKMLNGLISSLKNKINPTLS